jgi:hypothetical protein
MKLILTAVVTLGLALLLVLGGALAVSAFSGCNPALADPQQAAKLDPVSGYRGDQLAFAAVILNTISNSGVDARAGAIALTAAVARTGLRNLDQGEQQGLYGLPEQFGTAAERLNPSTATLRFLSTLTSNGDWTVLSPSEAAAAAIPGTRPADYQDSFAAAAAITQALRVTAAACTIGDDPVVLAQELVVAADGGQLRGLLPDHIKEIRWIAQGKHVTNCGIDTRILQIMVIAVRSFDEVTVSDINRRCTGQILGAGQGSTHWMDGGGHAVDFAALNGRAITGADPQSLRLIGILDPLVPEGSRIGQLGCRANRGIHLEIQHFNQFQDTCDHLHVDVFYAPR